jgi:EmrB/QacA subfamily drug resistance transporter
MANPSTDTSRKAALVVITMGAFLVPFLSSSLNVALPAMGKELGMGAVMLSWVSSAYLLAAAVFLVPFGRLADITGRKRIFSLGVVLYTASSVLAALAPSAATLIICRVLQGISGSMFSAGVAILTTLYPPGERGRALGINVTATYLGLSLGPFLGGFLTQHLGWRSLFWANLPIGIVMIALIQSTMKGEWVEARGEAFDWAGSVIYGASLVSLMMGFTRLPALFGGGLVLLGLLGLAGFIAWEMRCPSPVMDVRIFRGNAAFAFSNLAALIHYSATFAVSFLLSLYLQYIQGLSPQQAGVLLVAQPVMMALFSSPAGKLSDRLEPRVVASLGMGLSVLGLFLLTLLRVNTSYLIIVADLVLLGFGFALFSAPNTNAVMSSIEKKFYGVASATLGTMRLLGQMTSMGIVALLLALYVGRAAITPAVHPQFLRSTQAAFLVFGVLGIGGIFASLARGKVREA